MSELAGTEFTKMSGAGNDFILLDGRRLPAGLDTGALAARLCRRGLGIGADGLIVVEPAERADVRMRYFNSDGSAAPFCGNGSRCVARFAVLAGMAGPRLRIEYGNGTAEAELRGARVAVSLRGPDTELTEHRIEVAGRERTVYRVQVGVPHVVTFVDALERLDVVAIGRAIRHHPLTAPAGTNVNFARLVDPHELAVRSYERGIEDETLASATGCTSAVLAAVAHHGARSPVRCRTRSGVTVAIELDRAADGTFGALRMEGDARVVYRGVLTEESARWEEG